MSGFTQYCIHHNPIDIPGKFVVRRVTITKQSAVVDPEPVAIVNTLDDARKHVPSTHSFHMPRTAFDFATVVEVWMTEQVGAVLKHFGIVPRYCLKE